MRLKTWAALAAGVAGLMLAGSAPAAADGCEGCAPKATTVHHRVYYPRYAHVYHVDPYAYQYSPRGYYPYYNSGYWISSAAARRRAHLHYYHWNTQPPRYRYYAFWGSRNTRYSHLQWHHRHHGYHHRWQW